MSGDDRWRGVRRVFHLPVGARRVPDDVDEELRFHLDGRIEELMAQGLRREEAEAEARRRFGSIESYRRELREVDERIVRERSRSEWWGVLRRDTRRAVRTLARSPGFSIVALLTLALGLGATTAIYTLIDRVVLRPLPYPDADRLVYLSSPVPGVKPDAEWGLSQAGYFDFRQNSRSFEDIGIFKAPKLTLVSEAPAERVQSGIISASLAHVLRFAPALGRGILESDDRPGAAPVVVLGYDFWRTRFDGDTRVIGRTVNLEGHPVPIVGVYTREASLPDRSVDVWVAAQLDPAQPPVNSHLEFETIARLDDGVSLAAAQADVTALTSHFVELFPSAYSTSFMESTHFRTKVTPLRDHVVGGTARVLWILLAAVGLVLVIACANVANLFLARAESRRREVAIRSALGAGRAQLAWHYLTESLALSIAAGALGLLLANAALRLLVALDPAGLPRLTEVRLGWSSIAFAFVVSIAAGVIFGLFPLRPSGRSGVDVATLRDAGRGLSASRSQHAMRSALVIGQVALALVLLAAAGLLLQSFRRLRAVRPGFDPAGVVAIDIDIPTARYQGYERVAAFWRELERRLAALPGVASVGAAQSLPLDAEGCSAVFTEDRATERVGRSCVPVMQVTPGYFATMRIPVDGRAPDWNDTESGHAGVVVSRAFAERFWPGENAIGKGVRGNGYAEPYYRVVGIAGDVRGDGLDRPLTEDVYFPMIPMNGAPLWSWPAYMSVVVRTRGVSPTALGASIRATLAALDPNVPIASLRTMESVVEKSTARVTFTLLLIGIAAGMALTLSAVGLYGVISYLVGQRRGEIGVRIALGAGAAQVRGLIVRQSLRLVVIGIVLGLAGALAVTRVLRSLLFEVSPSDPVILVTVIVLLIVIAALASWVPALRASRVDPVEALRGT